MTDARDLKLHLGCGHLAPAGWVNVDASLGARLSRWAPLRWLVRALGLFRQRWDPDIVIHDLRRPFPWPDGSAAVIYSSHTLEHLSKEEGRRFLRECARVLAPDGVLRIVVPDLAAVLADYEKGEIAAVDVVDRLGVSYHHPADGWLKRRLAPLVRVPHRCMYDSDALVEALREVGLDARPHAPFLSRIRDLRDVEEPERTEGAVIVEAIRAER